MSVITETPSGATPVRNPNTRGNTTKYANAMPRKNRKVLETSKGNTKRFSRLYNPGAIKLHAWCKITGIARKIDKTNVSLNGVRNGDATSVAIILVPSGICRNNGSAR